MPERYPYTQIDPTAGEAGWSPLLPVTLYGPTREITTPALLDTGATVNVLPLEVGEALGLIWEAQRIPLRLTGNLGNAEARAVVLEAQVGGLERVRLAFAWTQAQSSKLLLGQINFFREFDVCFHGHALRFDIDRKQNT